MLKRICLALALIFAASSARAAIVISGHTHGATGDGNTTTSSSVDTSGCSSNCGFFVICNESAAVAIGSSAATDSVGNTYTASSADISDAAGDHVRVFHAVGVTTNASMTFKCTVTGAFPAVTAFWATGVAQSTPVDTSGSNNNNAGSATTLVVPSSALTAAASGELMISGFAAGTNSTSTATQTDGGTLTTDGYPTLGGVYYWGAAAGSVLSGTSDQITWTQASSANASGVMVLFKAAGAGPPPGGACRFALLGVGSC